MTNIYCGLDDLNIRISCRVTIFLSLHGTYWEQYQEQAKKEYDQVVLEKTKKDGGLKGL